MKVWKFCHTWAKTKVLVGKEHLYSAYFGLIQFTMLVWWTGKDINKNDTTQNIISIHNLWHDMLPRIAWYATITKHIMSKDWSRHNMIDYDMLLTLEWSAISCQEIDIGRICYPEYHAKRVTGIYKKNQDYLVLRAIRKGSRKKVTNICLRPKLLNSTSVSNILSLLKFNNLTNSSKRPYNFFTVIKSTKFTCLVITKYTNLLF